MLTWIFIVFAMVVASTLVANTLYGKAVTKISNRYSYCSSRVINDKKLWKISMIFVTIAVICIGLLGALLLAEGLRLILLFKDPLGAFLPIIAAEFTIIYGYNYIKRCFLNWEGSIWKAPVIIVLIAICLITCILEMQYIKNCVTEEKEHTEVIETIQLDPNRELDAVYIDGYGQRIGFWFIKDGVSEYSSVTAGSAEITYIESEQPYLEKIEVTLFINVTYPDDTVETRGVSTWKKYMFYLPKSSD